MYHLFQSLILVVSVFAPSFPLFLFFFQAEDGIRDLVRSRGLGDVYKRQGINAEYGDQIACWMSRLAVLVLCVLAVMCEGKARVKVFHRGDRSKWPQAMIVGSNWDAFVNNVRTRLELPASTYPTLKLYDSEDFEMQNPEEVDNGQYVFVDTSGQEVAPSLDGGALAHVPRDHFKKVGTKIHVWNYQGNENAETPPPATNTQSSSPQAGRSASPPDDQRAQLQARIAQLNQQMETFASNRQYGEAANAQAESERLTAQLESIPRADPNSAKRAQIQATLASLETQMEAAAAGRKYAEAAKLQEKHAALTVQLKTL
eukprot:TRINITY_DN14883_c0_g1_i1.p1 TRINITY_DN14883_c0_g1~~TRINITY_DN14883_c0_g1_i1.p1  ORF type:complete len:315 (+),score=74.53 TRINITY_DN14883_c0_g1_i1:62-1006(+)